MNQSLEKYLTAVDRHLKPLPVSERADIVKEIKSTMLEMESEQMSSKQILDRLGSPKDLAKAYLKDLLVKEKRCSVKRFLILWAFYTAAGFSGMVVIPVLAVIAPVFLLCGIAAPVLSAVKMFDYLLNLQIPFKSANSLYPEYADRFLWHYRLEPCGGVFLFCILWAPSFLPGPGRMEAASPVSGKIKPYKKEFIIT